MAHYVRICVAGTKVSWRTEEITAPNGSSHIVMHCSISVAICYYIKKSKMEYANLKIKMKRERNQMKREKIALYREIGSMIANNKPKDTIIQ